MPRMSSTRSFSEPFVVVCILNWNGLADTVLCLESLERSRYTNYQVVVVDNGSNDGSPAIIRGRFPRVVVIENPTNLGFTGGNNVGIQYAQDNEADYVWLLNNDTLVTPDTLERLVAFAGTDSEIGLLSPILYSDQAHQTIQFCGCWVDRRRHVVRNATRPEDLDNVPREDVVLWGTALLIRMSLVRRIGLMDDRYFAYSEDFDYSLRATENGYRNAIAPTAGLYHKFGGSVGSDQSPLRNYLRSRNDYLLWHTRLDGEPLRAYRTEYIACWISAAADWRARHQHQAANACVNGLWSALQQRFGPPFPMAKAPRLLRWLVFSHPCFAVVLLSEKWWTVLLEGGKRFLRKIVSRGRHIS